MDARRGGGDLSWLVVETETTVEVVPDFGREHVLEGECWCPTTREMYERELVIHEVMN